MDPWVQLETINMGPGQTIPHPPSIPLSSPFSSHQSYHLSLLPLFSLLLSFPTPHPPPPFSSTPILFFSPPLNSKPSHSIFKLTKYIYIKSTTVYVPSSKLELSQPLSSQRVCPFRRLEKKLRTLPTLCLNFTLHGKSKLLFLQFHSTVMVNIPSAI
jgi:hypothetical protein